MFKIKSPWVFWPLFLGNPTLIMFVLSPVVSEPLTLGIHLIAGVVACIVSTAFSLFLVMNYYLDKTAA